MLSVQFGASLAKEFFHAAGPAGTTAMRVFFSALILLILNRPWRESFSPQALRKIALYGCSLGTMNLLFYFALARIPLGLAVALEFVGPLGLALLSSKKILDLLWAFLAALGIYLILPLSELNQSLDVSGVLFALGAGLCWALYIVFGKSTTSEAHSAGAVTTIGMCFASLIALPAGLWLNFSQVTSPVLWPKGLLIAVLCGVLPFSLEMKAMRKLAPKTFGILMSLEPAIATLIGFLFLQESLNLTQAAAIISIMLASAGSAFSLR